MGKKARRKRERPSPPGSRPSALARVREEITICAIGLLLIVTPFLFNPWLVQPSSYDRFYLVKDAFVLSGMALCVAFWAVRAVWLWRWPEVRRTIHELLLHVRGRSLLVWEWCLVMFIILGFFSVLISSIPPLSYRALLTLSLAIFFYFFLSRSFSSLQMRRLLLLQVYIAGLVGLHCLAQYYGYEPGRLIGGENVTSQAIGYLGQVMATGAYLSVTVPVGVASFFAAPSLRSRLGLALAVIFCLSGLMATGSRAGNLGAMVGLGVFGLLTLYVYRWQVKAHWRMVFASCLLLGFLAVGISSQLPVFERLQTTLARLWAGEWEVAVGSRPHAWRIALYMVADRPFLGYGLSSYWKKQAEYEVRYGLTRPDVAQLEFYGHAHNEYLQVWVEMGILALLVVLIGLSALATYGIRRAFGASSTSSSNPINSTNPGDLPNPINPALEGLSQLHLLGLVSSLASITFVAFFSFIFHISSVVVPIILFVSALTANPTSLMGQAVYNSSPRPALQRGERMPLGPEKERIGARVLKYTLLFLIGAALFWSVKEVTRPFRASLLENQGDILLGREMVKGVGEARRDAFEAAVWWYGQAVEVYPGSPHANQALGMALTRLGRIPEAVDALKRVIEVAPGAETYLWLGQAYVTAGEIDKARQAFEMGRKIKGMEIFDQWLQALEEAR